MDSCVCCLPCKPRYKRLVDNIFPSSQDEGLVRSEMEKLTYYAVSAPEKLDRIGVYLAKHLTRNIQRKKNSYVFIAMEALNQLLLACHAQQINLFVESFLKMVATLLESSNLDFQALGTNSFIKFSKIEEDAPSYHRRYDFFVSKFTAMCHRSESSEDNRQNIQLHGVRGIRGVIRKTLTDELQVNIWEKQHMDKIIPSLLYTMQNHADVPLYEDGGQMPDIDSDCPWILAEESLRELLSRAQFANVPAAISPALAHLDSHKLWVPNNKFAIKCFKIIMFSIQSQYTHVIVKMLLDHIDAHAQEDQAIKASILEVMCAIVLVPSCAIGPSVIDVFNRISKHLKVLTKTKKQSKFESALIKTTQVLASVVPDYQKLEIMSFYMNKAFEALTGESNFDELPNEITKYSNLLIQCIKSISLTYQCSNNLSTLSSSLLDPFFKVSLLTDSSVRLLLQEVFISLVDKNSNFAKLKVVTDQNDIQKSGLEATAPGKQDIDFLDRRLPSIYHWLFASFMLEDNTAEGLIALYKCVATLSLSVASSDVIMALCCLTLSIQSSSIDWLNNSTSTYDMTLPVCRLMAATSCNMIVLSHLSQVLKFKDYVSAVLKKRKKYMPAFLPHILLNSEFMPSKLNLDKLPEVIFNSTDITSTLKGQGFNVEKLSQPFLSSLPLDNMSADINRSTIDVESITIQFLPKEEPVVEVDGLMPANAITFAHLKQVASKPPRKRAEQMDINRKESKRILSLKFEQLMAEIKPNPRIKALEFIKEVFSQEDEMESEDEGIENIELLKSFAF